MWFAGWRHIRTTSWPSPTTWKVGPTAENAIAQKVPDCGRSAFPRSAKGMLGAIADGSQKNFEVLFFIYCSEPPPAGYQNDVPPLNLNCCTMSYWLFVIGMA
jgi:hypothetical protein